MHSRCLRSRGWNRESNNNALSRTGSRFHSRRRKRRSSSKCVRTYIQLGSKSVTSRITSPIVRIQRPTQFESRVRRFQARLNRLLYASIPSILLSPTKSISTVAQYPTTTMFIRSRQVDVDIWIAIVRDSDGTFCCWVPRLEVRTASIAKRPCSFIPIV